MNKLIELFNQGDPVALGRLLKEVENGTAIGYEVLKHSAVKKGNTHVVGITGPPGAGKSTLVGNLCSGWADQGLKIGVICVDPSSPFSGGALLGDRIRMQELSKLPNVFIKSLATRGSLGGIAASTADIVLLMDAFGKDIIVVETVGVGQVEHDILDISDTVVLVNVPGLGDTLQTMKAGIMEVADLYVINQADRPGADESVRDLKMMIRELEKVGWQPPVLQTIATQKVGIKELMEEIDHHKAYLHYSELWDKKRQERNTKRLYSMIEELFSSKVKQYVESKKDIGQRIAFVRDGQLDPFTVAQEIVDGIISAN
ncbi:methylmalonyl Co-A mutase-associated GTPase MeaB [Effusibacillus dendaii]|uniref:Methylmalonyl Co-A mutase-associated GTPase MeaB n=1 Tax=Effusibacillus dendaii TaxID=2743772 RepID=A0A7I8D6B4_9BACL|nr:methylmalonyl Co-A mutase-associated GTPase MeaB [Effusibacillus dendaii]BCJ85698.1 methylmalonyl Co-A mutase-associated GTPase MeaB [Effusibacillus dendaii]